MDNQNKLFLAPMVRVESISFGMLATEYGADITYGEEIIDHRLHRFVPHPSGRLEMIIETGDHFFLDKCRKFADRPRDRAKWNKIADVDAALSIPVIANGDVFDSDDC